MASTVIQLGDLAYPTSLASLVAEARTPAFRAPALHVRGSLPPGPGVAIVGTRSPSVEALAFTRDLVTELARHRLAIWSGGARGIDAAAHEAALMAGALTVVVAGGGLDRPYPPEHAPLFDRILDAGGALVARVADHVHPSPPNFLQRNVILAAATGATVVIQAGLKSGARSTAAAARRLGRPLLAVPHAPWDARGAGCAAELARGARPLVCAAQVIEAMAELASPEISRGLARPRLRRPASSAILLPFAGTDDRAKASVRPPGEAAAIEPENGAQRALLGALGEQPLHLDELCDRAGLALPVALEELLTLTWQAVVVEGPAGFFRRVRRSHPRENAP